MESMRLLLTFHSVFLTFAVVEEGDDKEEEGTDGGDDDETL